MKNQAHHSLITDVKIGFIGGGNMAQAIVGGLLEAGAPSGNLKVADPNAEQLSGVYTPLNVSVSTDNAQLIVQCDVVVLAVKPQVMRPVLEPLGPVIGDNKPLLLSIAAGIPAALLEHWSAAGTAIVRTIPNTPALLGAGATGLYANQWVSPAQLALAKAILGAVGVVVTVDDESLIDSITAVSGSGPAYFFYMIEALEAAAINQGLSSDHARLLSRQTALGAAKLAAQSPLSAAQLREQVTSAGGTTAAALDTLMAADFSDIINNAVASAALRAGELAEMANIPSKSKPK